MADSRRRRMPLARYGFRRQILSPLLLAREIAAHVRMLANLVDAVAQADHRFAGLAARIRRAADVIDERERRDQAERHRRGEVPERDGGGGDVEHD